MWRKWHSPNNIANGLLWLVGLAVQIGGWANQTIAFTLLGIALLWTLASVIYWLVKRTHKGNKNNKVVLLKITDTYEDNNGECGLIFSNTSSTNLTKCQARLIDSAFETPHSRYSLGRYFKAEDLICTQNIAQFSNGKIPLFRWGSGAVDKNLEIIYQRGTRTIGYDIVSIPILILLNVWAETMPNMYAVCKLEDRLGWGFKLSILETGLQRKRPQLSTFQLSNSRNGDSQT
jgi:hypothetical protein